MLNYGEHLALTIALNLSRFLSQLCLFWPFLDRLYARDNNLIFPFLAENYTFHTYKQSFIFNCKAYNCPVLLQGNLGVLGGLHLSLNVLSSQSNGCWRETVGEPRGLRLLSSST